MTIKRKYDSDIYPFELKLADIQMPSGKLIPGKSKKFRTAGEMWEWYNKNRGSKKKTTPKTEPAPE